MTDTATKEKVAEGRWVIRVNGLRAGMVIGGNKTYGAETVSGKPLGYRTTIKEAMDLIVNS